MDKIREYLRVINALISRDSAEAKLHGLSDKQVSYLRGRVHGYRYILRDLTAIFKATEAELKAEAAAEELFKSESKPGPKPRKNSDSIVKKEEKATE